MERKRKREKDSGENLYERNIKIKKLNKLK